jgi:NAD(P)-dependent dehydrogenase (short-subunit alcohol dehydrogenase family)
MSIFQGKIAIVTGGASGIGKALCEALAREGAEVLVADVNAAGAEAVAEGITRAGGKARAEALDVRDAAAFRALAEGEKKRAGRIDYFFNNAGIAVNGEVRDITLDDWKPVIDVDLYGVVHGVTAVYPIMVAQGSGHIVNTASAAGLIPAPGITSYAAAKHGVVGLSRSLRAEGADLGVKVSVVCPGFIETPILHTSRSVGVDTEALLKKLPLKAISAEACAEAILKGVARNHAVIVVTWQAKLGWLLERAFPWLLDRVALKVVRDVRAARRETGAEKP